MNLILPFLLFTLLLSSTHSQTSTISGTWVPAFYTNPTACCVPNSLTIAFGTSSNIITTNWNFTNATNNTLCQTLNILGSFQSTGSLIVSPNTNVTAYVEVDGSTSVTLTLISSGNSIVSIPNITVTQNASLEIGVSGSGNTSCTYSMLPSTADNLIADWGQNLTGTWIVASSIGGMMGGIYNVTTCCVPNTIQISLAVNSTVLYPYVVDFVYYFAANVTNNTWCQYNNIAGGLLKTNASILPLFPGWADTITGFVVLPAQGGLGVWYNPLNGLNNTSCTFVYTQKFGEVMGIAMSLVFVMLFAVFGI